MPSKQVSALSPVQAWSIQAALGALVFLGTAACSTKDSAGSHDSTTTDTSESGMMSSETDTDDATEDTTFSGGSFYGIPEDFPPISECDPWFQDCPVGEKCVPYASTGGSYDGNKCVPIFGDGQPGDACVYDGAWQATDDCDGSSMCWDAMLVDGEQVGTCTPFCVGTPDQPQCDDGSSCVVSHGGTVTLCLDDCDPLAQDCADGAGCYWYSGTFACVSAGEDPLGQSCEFINSCLAGSACVDAELVADCAGSSCCAEFCSLVEPTCSEPTSECVPFFDASPPAGYEDLGLCISP